MFAISKNAIADAKSVIEKLRNAVANGNAGQLKNCLPFDSLSERLLRGFGGGGQRMIVNVSLDHKCHVNKMTDRAVSRDEPRVASAPRHVVPFTRHWKT